MMHGFENPKKETFFETAQGDGDELSAVLCNSVWYIVEFSEVTN
jgi:hypothetical protein